MGERLVQHLVAPSLPCSTLMAASASGRFVGRWLACRRMGRGTSVGWAGLPSVCEQPCTNDATKTGHLNKGGCLFMWRSVLRSV